MFNLNIMKKRWLYLSISGVIILSGFVSMLFNGFNLGTDFAGGISLTYALGQEFDTADVEAIASEALGIPSIVVQKVDNTDVSIKFGYSKGLSLEEQIAFGNEKTDALTSALKSKYDATAEFAVTPVEPIIDEVAEVDEADEADDSAEVDEANDTNEDTDITETETPEDPLAPVTNETLMEQLENAGIDTENVNIVGGDLTNTGTTPEIEEPGIRLLNKDDISPSTGQDLAKTSLWMALIACLAMLMYISVRFEFVSGMVAIIALLHDVLVVLGIYSIFKLPINLTFIAAILTILGYSINNTIIVFDRIRENMRGVKKKQTHAEIAENSIAQTLFRSLNTVITTLIMIGVLYILGVPSIKEFSLPIILGILAGTYSSLFIVGSVWALWKDAGTDSAAPTPAKK